MSEKITGYILLIVGIILMVFSVIQIVGVFTGKAKPIAIFQQEPSNISEETNIFDTSSLLDQLQQTNPNLSIPDVQLIDPETMNSLLNLLIYYLIMQFLLSFGYKLSSLGIQLLRPIQVMMKNRELTSDPNDNKTNVNKIN